MISQLVINESGGFGDPFLWSVAQVLSKFGGSVGGKKAAAAAGAIASWLRLAVEASSRMSNGVDLEDTFNATVSTYYIVSLMMYNG